VSEAWHRLGSQGEPSPTPTSTTNQTAGGRRRLSAPSTVAD
jgi:hypothetical protein